jgi:hypothetical protein
LSVRIIRQADANGSTNPEDLISGQAWIVCSIASARLNESSSFRTNISVGSYQGSIADDIVPSSYVASSYTSQEIAEVCRARDSTIMSMPDPGCILPRAVEPKIAKSRDW